MKRILPFLTPVLLTVIAALLGCILWKMPKPLTTYGEWFDGKDEAGVDLPVVRIRGDNADGSVDVWIQR